MKIKSVKQLNILNFIVLIAFFVFNDIVFSNEEARLLRFPAIHENKIVFSYAGDLYVVASDGGIARRITSHEGYEMFPRFSPDGSKIAFTGQYDGNTEVFLIPAEGGVPERITYTATLSRDDVADRMGPNNIVMAWAPDGKHITYRSRKQSFNPFIGSLYNVPVEGGLSTEIPLSTGGFCSYSPDGTKMAFNRVFREFRTWKYYKGGMADDIWIYDLKTHVLENITGNNFQDIIPMWVGNEIYFMSDRERTMNLYVYNIITKLTSKITDFTEFDCKFPSFDNRSIVFENGGFIYKLDVATKKYLKVSIEVKNDLPYVRGELKDLSKSIRYADLSPLGKRIVVGARGDIFSAPSENGVTYNLTKSPGVHDRDPVWSPDGKYIAYVSDESGECEIYIIDQTGNSKPEQVTKNTGSYIFGIKWSPDGKKILWNDRKLNLQFIDIESRKITVIRKSELNAIQNFNWSKDSRWVVFDDLGDNFYRRIYVYDLQNKKTNEITDPMFDSFDPVFSDDGKYVAFISDRDFSPVYNRVEWNHAYIKMSRIYLVALNKSVTSPFSLLNDVVETAGAGKDAKEKNDSLVNIEFDGILQRVVALPVEVSDYRNVNLMNGKVYYINDGGNGPNKLKIFDLKEKKEQVALEGLSNYAVSADNKKMICFKDGKLYVIDVPSGSVSLDKSINTGDVKTMTDFKAEWEQIYNESWRQMRDFFYAENMHGANWDAMKTKYAPLVPYAAHRNDLTYIIGELIGELSVGHAYVSGGDRIHPERINTGLLGAKISRHVSGYFKIDEILEGANWDANLRSPLKEMGVTVNEGDFIISVDGTETKNCNDIYSLLIGKSGKTVELGISKTPDNKNVKKELIVPVADESNLYYYNWVQDNIKKVEEATNGQVGYVHIPDMLTEGLNEFAKYYYSQLDKKALIIDDRGNGGGNVSPMIIERLKREIIRQRSTRNVDIGIRVPGETMNGPKVLLVNEYSASDGDLFAYAFKKFELGPVIGKRTWGGVVGITGSLPFIDGGDLRKPEFSSFSSEKSEWIVEGHGVDPDIYVDNNPYDEYNGKDAQLDKAIEVILEQLKNYNPLPAIPEMPDKTK